MKYLLYFLAGFLLVPVGDYAHVATSTTGYPQDYAFYLFTLLPWWVPLLFGSAALAIGVTHLPIDRMLGGPAQRRGSVSWSGVAAGMTAFVGLYVLSGFLPWPAGGLSDLTLATAAILVWFFLDRTWQGAALAVSTAFTGTLVEALLVNNGVFFYQDKANNLFGVASWLPWLYVTASVAMANFARRLETVLAR